VLGFERLYQVRYVLGYVRRQRGYRWFLFLRVRFLRRVFRMLRRLGRWIGVAVCARSVIYGESRSGLKEKKSTALFLSVKIADANGQVGQQNG
jgi:hypothetical protein